MQDQNSGIHDGSGRRPHDGPDRPPHDGPDRPPHDGPDRPPHDRPDRPPHDGPDRPGQEFRIRIDRTDYTVRQEKLSGAELRRVPDPPIPEDRDLYQVVPGHSDRKIKDDDTVPMHDGLRFFTAPNTINPGCCGANSFLVQVKP